MIDFDQTATWRTLEEHLATLTSPRQQAILQTVIDHAKAEAAADVDGLMKTLVDEPQYHFWSRGGDNGPKGYDAVRTYYGDYVESGAAILMAPMDRIIVSDNSVANESVMTTLGSWRIAKQRGYAIPEERGHYAMRMQIVNLWTFDDDARAYGEDAYTSIDPTDFDRLDDDELPSVYVDYLKSIGHEV